MKPTPLKRHPELLSIGRKDLPTGSVSAEAGLDRSEVSRKHIDLIVYVDGRIDLVDRNSSNGTFVYEGAGWSPVEKQTQVSDSTRVRLGGLYEATVGQLIASARGTSGNRLPNATNVVQKKRSGKQTRWVRNPETGEPEEI